MTSWRDPALALVWSLAVGMLTLYALELGFRLLGSDPAVAAIERAEAAGRPFDPRSRMEVVRDLRARGVDAVPRVVPAGLREQTPDGEFRSQIAIDGREVLPLAGISRRTTVLCNETGEYAIYESDEHGFRNPQGMWDQGAVDLVLLGDSFTIGECVGAGESLSDRLRAHLPATVNLGYSGNSPLLELATLAEYGPALAPRATLWFYFENDLAWFDLGKDRRTPLLMRYLGSDFRQGLLALQPEIDRSLEAIVESTAGRSGDAGPIDRLKKARGGPADRLGRLLRLQKLRSAIGRLRGPRTSSRAETPAYELFGAILSRARETVEAWEGELVFVYLPGVWNFQEEVGVPHGGSAERPERVKALAASLGLRLIDVEAAMHAHDDPLSLFSYRGVSILGPPHMNAAGYAYSAGIVIEQLGR
jgi:hypothetical protein